MVFLQVRNEIPLLIEVQQRSQLRPLFFTHDCHKRIVKKMGCEDTRFHDLRHTYATACIKSGVDIKTLQDNLGHSDVQTTLNIYSHVFDSMKEASAHQVEAYYSELKKEK